MFSNARYKRPKLTALAQMEFVWSGIHRKPLRDTENTVPMSSSREMITVQCIRLHIYIITMQSLQFDNQAKPHLILRHC